MLILSYTYGWLFSRKRSKVWVIYNLCAQATEDFTNALEDPYCAVPSHEPEDEKPVAPPTAKVGGVHPCVRSVATPARAARPELFPGKVEPGQGQSPTTIDGEVFDSDVPDALNQEAERPVAGVIRISDGAMNARLRRVFEPSKVSGKRKVSDAICKMWQSKGKSRDKIYKLFQSCGYCKDSMAQTQLVYFSGASLFNIPCFQSGYPFFARTALSRNVNYSAKTVWRMT